MLRRDLRKGFTELFVKNTQLLKQLIMQNNMDAWLKSTSYIIPPVFLDGFSRIDMKNPFFMHGISAILAATVKDIQASGFGAANIKFLFTSRTFHEFFLVEYDKIVKIENVVYKYPHSPSALPPDQIETIDQAVAALKIAKSWKITAETRK